MLKFKFTLGTLICIVPTNAVCLGYKINECISFGTMIAVRKAHQEMKNRKIAIETRRVPDNLSNVGLCLPV